MVRVFERRPRLRRRGLAVISVVAALIALVVVFASPYEITSISMTGTIQPGEVVLVDRMNPELGLQRGEVIVFHPPSDTSGVLFIKRVIGLPGDHISIVNAVVSGNGTGVVSVNGRQLDEPYLAPNTVTLTSGWDFETTVPAGSVFVMGDDRMESWDSRSYGSVPLGNIVGRAWLVLSPSLSIAGL
jgi:signal peptidase I